MTKRIKRYILLSAVIVGYLLIAPVVVHFQTRGNIEESLSQLEAQQVAIVFGAGIKSNGQPSDVLRDRLITAADLYAAGAVDSILVSGDNRRSNYSEPDVMADYLIQQEEIPPEAIYKDHAGRRSYDTCIRAKEIWGVERAILVTQQYHLPRVIFTCENKGIESVGISATRQTYVGDQWYGLREWLALHKMFIDLFVWSPEYIGGNQEADLVK